MQSSRRLARAPPPRTLFTRLYSSSSSLLPANGAGDGAGSSRVGGVAVKQVTRGNLAEALEELRARVRDAAFVGLDLEMSGVTSAPWRDTFELDRADVRYLKLRDSAQRFAALQLGVCPFRWDPAKSAFVAHPHNFFIFPRKELPDDISSHEFLCQTTSIDFLAKYQFDFNTCFHEGISYLSRAQEEEALQKLNVLYHDGIASPNTSEEEDVPLRSTADLLFTERMKIKFKEWRDVIISNPRMDNHWLECNKFSTHQFQTVFFKMHPAILLNGFTSHQLKLIQQKDLQEDLLRSREARVKSAVGIRHVIDLLASERKLIVGHSCFLDIAQVYSKFIGPLPSTVKEFALGIHKILPYIADTRHLMSASDSVQYLMRQKSKSLSSVFSLLCPAFHSTVAEPSTLSPVRIEVEADETMLSCFASGAKHEAGYDAFMTGCVFAQLCDHLDVKFEHLPPRDNLAMNNKLQKYINLLSPSFNSGTSLDLSTGMERPDTGYKRRYPTVLYDNVVLIWGYQSELRPRDIKDCICKVFGPASVTTIFSIDSTAVLVQFSKQESVNDFMDLKAALEKTDSAISVLHPLSTILEGGKTRAANYDTYRDICGSSVSKYFFADQAEAVCSSSKSLLKCENIDAADTPGVILNESILDETIPTSEKHAGGTKNVSKKEDDSEISCQDILDALQDGKALFDKRTRST
ncbi:poly(A)-specific ribonuclease PARN isoform X2 [Brachypodium distachyon]|uniref:poly(A)-specific ribonuclease PARN isoform X2 n=1 Tax=Brachypodium distachyon TaxID=15368 RepID=UPI00052FE988|nr:poly(A)-specific ribonuclease PARN isoform X2 [Brachypodium distachyon]|eukprot:XP_010240011.1 poly(A)-specific ribonuclease PARN isoform X2 [Brachypodium distachyon]